MPNEFEIEADERGFVLVVSTTGGDLHRFGIPDGEAFYDHVKATIGPWLYERDMAKANYEFMTGQHAPFKCSADDVDESGSFEPLDPKSEGYHERMSAVADDREKV